ncbi:MAG TPA: hypothetical protein ENO36_03605 [Fervidicoccus fontis]|uniref:Uncharacterized protein n=2 Tax=Fervidicoccus fontis TaxID=683846 RepID=A0A7C2UJP3_9CREN|nr:hypothetical protein [Fervidicoccus fontis]
MSSQIEICKYTPERELDYYTSGIASIMRVIRKGESSTYAYVKEVRRALETLVFDIWDKADSYIFTLASSNMPDEIRSNKLRDCFMELSMGLMRKFYETTKDLPIGARIKLMNMIISSIAEMSKHSPPQFWNDLISKFFEPKLSNSFGSSNQSSGENV